MRQNKLRARRDAIKAEFARRASLQSKLSTSFSVFVDDFTTVRSSLFPRIAERQQDLLKDAQNAPSVDQERVRIKKQIMANAHKRIKLVRELMVGLSLTRSCCAKWAAHLRCVGSESSHHHGTDESNQGRLGVLAGWRKPSCAAGTMQSEGRKIHYGSGGI